MAESIIKVNENELTEFNVPEGFFNTCDITTDDGKHATVNAINGAVSLKDYEGQPLNICDCIVMPGIRKSRDGGEDKPCKNVYLIDVDGKAYFSQSDGVAHSVQWIAALWPDFGKNTTDDGFVTLYLKAQELPNGNTLKTLVTEI